MYIAVYILQSCVRLNEKGAQSLQTGLTTDFMGLCNCFWMVRPHQSSAAPESAPRDIQGRLSRPRVNCKDVIGSTVNEARMNGIPLLTSLVCCDSHGGGRRTGILEPL